MTDTAALQARLDSLLAARAKGVRRVRAPDREIEFATDAEMAAAIADLEQRLADAQGRRVHTMKLFTSKGL